LAPQPRQLRSAPTLSSKLMIADSKIAPWKRKGITRGKGLQDAPQDTGDTTKPGRLKLTRRTNPCCNAAASAWAVGANSSNG
jgi:hypothetical protein